jgi:peroxiredoxin
MDRIRERGAELLAVSVDSAYTLRVFAASLGGLPFQVGSDFMREASRAYGVLNEQGGYAARSVFVIDGQGQIVYENRAFGAGNPEHYEAALAALPA